MTKKQITITAIALFIISAIWFSSCKKDEPTPDLSGKGNVEFSLNVNTLKKIQATKGVAAYNLDDAIAIILTIQHSDGSPTDFTTTEVTLYNMAGSFFSEKLPLTVGNYKLTQFVLVNDTGCAIFACPNEGTPLEANVSDAVPIAFTVSKDNVTEVTVEVLSTETLSPEDFGFVTFNIVEVSTFSFLLTVFELGSNELLKADVTVESGSYVYTQTLDSITGNQLKVKDGFANYTLTVEKAGYQTYVHTFADTLLKSYTNVPLVVELAEIPTFSFLLTVLESGSSNLLSADVTVESGNYVHTQALAAVTGNVVEIEDGFASYTLTVEKAGYQTYTNTFTDTELKSYISVPLVVELAKETFSFLLTVRELGSSNLLSADVTVESGSYVHTQALAAITGNVVVIEDGYANYTLTVEKSGYHIYTNTFTGTELKSYTSVPLVVELEEEAVAGTVTDFDGNVYPTVQIGNQTWMAENLKSTHYANGTPLVDGTGVGNISTDYTTKYYFAFNDDPGYVATYGRLYTWAAVMNGAPSSNNNPSGVQGVCPTGWHVPSDEEWKEMEMFLGMSQAQADGLNARGTDEGGKLKEAGTTHWMSPNTGATNVTGFTALPSAGRDYIVGFLYFPELAIFWTSSEMQTNPSAGWFRIVRYNASHINRNGWYKPSGFSVRCVKD